MSYANHAARSEYASVAAHAGEAAELMALVVLLISFGVGVQNNVR